MQGVNFLPAQVAHLSAKFPIRAVLLGRSSMTLEIFDTFPGRSPGYGLLPEEMCRPIVEDVPRWSAFLREEAERSGYPYVDTAGDFPQQLLEAESFLRRDKEK